MIAERRQRLDVATARLPRPTELTQARRAKLDHLAHRLPQGLGRRTHAARLDLSRRAGRLSARLLTARTERLRDRLDDCGKRLDPTFARLVRGHGDRLKSLARLFGSLHYKEALKRGYAIVRGDAGEVLTRAAQVAAGAGLEIEFTDGRVGATAHGEGPARPKKRRGPGGGPDRQGSLF